MPKEIKDMRAFVKQMRRPDAKSLEIKKNDNSTKFKLRLSNYLYTHVVKDVTRAQQLADQLKKSLPAGLKATVVSKKESKRKVKK